MLMSEEKRWKEAENNVGRWMGLNNEIFQKDFLFLLSNER